MSACCRVLELDATPHDGDFLLDGVRGVDLSKRSEEVFVFAK